MTPLDVLVWTLAGCGSLALVGVTVAVVISLISGALRGSKPKGDGS